MLAEYLCVWVGSIPIVEVADPARLMARARHPLLRMQPAIEAFWTAYRAAAPDGPALRRVIELAAVRLLQTAVERAQALAAPSAHVVTLVQLADNMLRRPGRRGGEPAGAARVSRYRDQVAAAIAAVTIRGPTPLRVAGPASGRLPPALDAALDDARAPQPPGRVPARGALPLVLLPRAPRAGAPRRAGPAAADPRLAAALSQANAGRGSWEAGWTVERLDGDEAVVTGARLRMRVALGDCRPRRRRRPAPR